VIFEQTHVSDPDLGAPVPRGNRELTARSGGTNRKSVGTL
jgi:hypothetical protein